MTSTARRRWTRELENEVDGIAVGDSGPVLVHGYDPPAGGRWIDSAIPGKLGALDRKTGDILWTSPCEVGYGRGFGVGFGASNDIVVLGPSTNGHRVVRMSLENGELLDASDVPEFDEALVFEDLVLLASAKQLLAIDTETLEERWRFKKEGHRLHNIARTGDRIFVVYSNLKTRKQGVLCLTKKGKTDGGLLEPNQRVIHGVSADPGGVAILLSDLEAALPREVLLEYLVQRGDEDSVAPLALVAMEPTARVGDAPLWYDSLDYPSSEEFPEVSITADSGKVYVIQGALLDVRDALTGRKLDQWAVPGLDERVGWQVSQGAGLLAEETRLSVFELPA